MYYLRPLIESKDNLYIKSPMYSMRRITIRNIKLESYETEDEDSILHGVEMKQDELLKQINEIRDLLATLKAELSKPEITVDKEQKIMDIKNLDFSKIGVIHEVVLNASVKNPPFSLLVLNKLWPDLITFVFSWHIHSSIRGLPKTLKKFENLNAFNHERIPGTQLRIRVVWKEVWSDCELVVSPLNCTPLLGEVNFLRFLNSCVPPKDMDSYNLSWFETKLDICHCLQHCDNFQQIQEYYTVLSDGLEKNIWLAGNKFTILDIACWSVISNMKSPNLNPSLNEWFKRCNDYVGVAQ